MHIDDIWANMRLHKAHLIVIGEEDDEVKAIKDADPPQTPPIEFDVMD